MERLAKECDHLTYSRACPVVLVRRGAGQGDEVLEVFGPLSEILDPLPGNTEQVRNHARRQRKGERLDEIHPIAPPEAVQQFFDALRYHRLETRDFLRQEALGKGLAQLLMARWIIEHHPIRQHSG